MPCPLSYSDTFSSRNSSSMHFGFGFSNALQPAKT